MARFPDGMTAMRARQAVIQADLRELIAAGAREEELTSREREVLVLLQGSLSVREIADALYLSTNTVKTHIQALYRKLGAHSRDRRGRGGAARPTDLDGRPDGRITRGERPGG